MCGKLEDLESSRGSWLYKKAPPWTRGTPGPSFQKISTFNFCQFQIQGTPGIAFPKKILGKEMLNPLPREWIENLAPWDRIS